jgi:hypothetical protein
MLTNKDLSEEVVGEGQEVTEKVHTEEQSEGEVGNKTDVDSEADSEQEAIEAEASAAGWKSNGKLDAKTFLEHKEVLSSKERSKRLIEEQKETKKQLEEVTARLKKQEEAAERIREHQEKAHQKELALIKSEATSQLASLKALKAEAIRNGDGEAVNEIDERIDVAKDRIKEAEKPAVEIAKSKEQEKVKEPEQTPPHVDFEPWKAENKWFTENKKLGEFAYAQALMLKNNGSTLVGRDFFDLVKEKVREHYPDEFGNPNRKRAGAVETSHTATAYKGKTVDDLDKAGKIILNDALESGAYKKAAKEAGMTPTAYFIKQYFK